MAYSHTQYQYLFPSGHTATSLGNKASWRPGYMPHMVRAAGVISTISGSVTSGMVVAFLHASLATTGTQTTSDLAVLTLTSGTAGRPVVGHEVVYKDNLNVKVSPGQSVIFNVRTAVTGVSGVRGFLWVEPTWETPDNNAQLHATT